MQHSKPVIRKNAKNYGERPGVYMEISLRMKNGLGREEVMRGGAGVRGRGQDERGRARGRARRASCARRNKTNK